MNLRTRGGTVVLGSIAFAQHTRWRSIHSGRFVWTLSVSGKPVVHGTATVGDGAYDIVALIKRTTVRLGIYRTRSGEPGTSLLRVIHAAAELGAPLLQIDDREVVTRLSYAHATPYVSINPGTHSLGAMRPGDSTPLASDEHLHVTPGVAYSVFVLGSRGQRVRLVTLTDRGAPLVRRSSRGRSSPVPAGSRHARSVVVRPGDSLWTIAHRQLGPAADNEEIEDQVVAIWNLNAEHVGTGDPNLIFAGQRLRLPPGPESAG